MSENFKPYEQVNGQRPSRRDYGPYTRLVYEYELRCLTVECTPGVLSAAGSREPVREERRTFRFAPTRLFERAPANARPSFLRDVFWPPLVSLSRIDEAQAGAQYPVRANPKALPKQSAWISAPLLAGALLVVAVGLLVWPGSVALAWLKRRRPTPNIAQAAELTPIERALQLVEWAHKRPDGPERREALERLATVLSEMGSNGLVTRARELAWTRRFPSAEAAAELVAVVKEADGRSA